jgi:hypothetical protein
MVRRVDTRTAAASTPIASATATSTRSPRLDSYRGAGTVDHEFPPSEPIQARYRPRRARNCVRKRIAQTSSEQYRRRCVTRRRHVMLRDAVVASVVEGKNGAVQDGSRPFSGTVG